MVAHCEQRYYRLRYFEQDATNIHKESIDLLRNDVGVSNKCEVIMGGYLKEIKLILNQAFEPQVMNSCDSDTGKIAVLIPYNEEAKELIKRLKEARMLANKKRYCENCKLCSEFPSADEVARLGNAILTIADGMAMVLNENYYSTKQEYDTPALEVLFK